ncbi:hypothetical protein M23134_07371 [Microscilla marina ATCC 23134]|uniref:Uncharacterized protein n=1 Tax=Microscilla marina ATCC 23134 TaxID=313606 RepID=A1ZEL2_MICM2|nr:hypothetical protein M23134_07371 [Microscilla marina ATCC 23134]
MGCLHFVNLFANRVLSKQKPLIQPQIRLFSSLQINKTYA